jgi:hypothetical protein
MFERVSVQRKEPATEQRVCQFFTMFSKGNEWSDLEQATKV